MTQVFASNIHHYFKIIASFHHGFDRFQNSRIVALTASNIILQYHTNRSVSKHNEYPEKVCELLDGVSKKAWEDFDYTTNISNLVYVTTIFDTFLSDTTNFLMLLNPPSIGKTHMFQVDDIVSATSVSELLNQAILKKVRDISYLPFIGRIKYLGDTFGVSIKFSDIVFDMLEKYSGIRNVIVHDQGLYNMKLDDSKKIKLEPKIFGHKPTLVKNEELKEAQCVYIWLFMKISKDVMSRILKNKSHDKFNSMIMDLEVMLKNNNFDL